MTTLDFLASRFRNNLLNSLPITRKKCQPTQSPELSLEHLLDINRPNLCREYLSTESLMLVSETLEDAEESRQLYFQNKLNELSNKIISRVKLNSENNSWKVKLREQSLRILVRIPGRVESYYYFQGESPNFQRGLITKSPKHPFQFYANLIAVQSALTTEFIKQGILLTQGAFRFSESNNRDFQVKTSLVKRCLRQSALDQIVDETGFSSILQPKPKPNLRSFEELHKGLMRLHLYNLAANSSNRLANRVGQGQNNLYASLYQQIQEQFVQDEGQQCYLGLNLLLKQVGQINGKQTVQSSKNEQKSREKKDRIVMSNTDQKYPDSEAGSQQDLQIFRPCDYEYRQHTTTNNFQKNKWELPLFTPQKQSLPQKRNMFFPNNQLVLDMREQFPVKKISIHKHQPKLQAKVSPTVQSYRKINPQVYHYSHQQRQNSQGSLGQAGSKTPLKYPVKVGCFVIGKNNTYLEYDFCQINKGEFRTRLALDALRTSCNNFKLVLDQRTLNRFAVQQTVDALYQLDVLFGVCVPTFSNTDDHIVKREHQRSILIIQAISILAGKSVQTVVRSLIKEGTRRDFPS